VHLKPASQVDRDAIVLDLKDVCVNLGPDCILSDVNLTVKQGEVVGVAGPNGGGKTTLLRAVLGLTPTCCGTIRFFGKPLNGSAERRRIGYIAQNAAHIDLTFPASVKEVVMLGRVAPRGLLRRLNGEDRALAMEALQEVGMDGLANRQIGALSGGERQRVLLARALASRPDILFMDEPTTGFDPEARSEFVKLLRHLNEEHAITMLLVSHETDILSHAARRLVVVDRTIIHDGPIDLDTPMPAHLHLGDPLVKP
jgi:zinc transport system ATP-binding protein